MPGREDRTQSLIERCELDYVDRLGALPRRPTPSTGTASTSGRRARSPRRCGAATSRRWRQAARSGLFDILAHPDLVKMWGSARPRPDGDPRRYYEPALEAIAESGIAVEVSTAGLRKPVGEIYPAPAFLDGVRRRRRAGRALERRPRPRARRLRLRRGRSSCSTAPACSELAMFERRVRRLEPIGLMSVAHRHRLRQPPAPRGRRARSSGGVRARRRDRARRATPTPTCSPTP